MGRVGYPLDGIFLQAAVSLVAAWLLVLSYPNKCSFD